MYHNISGSSKGDSINTKSQTEQAKKCSSYFLNITNLGKVLAEFGETIEMFSHKPSVGR